MIGELFYFAFWLLYMAVGFGPVSLWLHRLDTLRQQYREFSTEIGRDPQMPPNRWRTARRFTIGLALTIGGQALAWILLGGLDRGASLAAWRAYKLIETTWSLVTP